MNQTELTRPELSICIATYNRAGFIGQTLESILPQLVPEVELLVVDGASTDNTESTIDSYRQRHSALRYIREPVNSGVDADFDKAVTYARGNYCWLMTDDDLLVPGAVDRVLIELVKKPDLIVVDAEVRTNDFKHRLEYSRMSLSEDQYFQRVDDAVMRVAGNALSFIGSVVIRRQRWLERDRKSYYGSLFIHVGVIFQQPPLSGVSVLCKPLVQIRYGNAMWTPRSFEIWMFIWPRLIWGLPGFDDTAKGAVCEKEPWRRAMVLFKHRAKGSYSITEYRKYIMPIAPGFNRIVAAAIALVPASLANLLAVAYVVTLNREARLGLVDLLDSPNASAASRLLGRLFPLSPPGN